MTAHKISKDTLVLLSHIDLKKYPVYNFYVKDK